MVHAGIRKIDVLDRSNDVRGSDVEEMKLKDARDVGEYGFVRGMQVL